MTVKELREQTGLSQQKFGEYFGIPYRTIQNWEAGKNECSQYILDMMEYKLRNEGIICDNEFKIEATIVMSESVTVEQVRVLVADALKVIGAKGMVLKVE